MRQMRLPAAALAAIVALSAAEGAAQRSSERRVANPGETQFELQLLRPSGGPVVPIFEGWYRNPDGTFELSFGYFNVNTEETLEIPLGPGNFIEPAEFDGGQPTRFEPVPENDRRHGGAFTVTVPADFGARDVVWTLRAHGQTLSVPGRLTSSAYELAGWEFPGRSSVSPRLRLAPDGPEGRGPRGIAAAEERRARVGEPLELAAWVARDAEAGRERPINVKWFKHQGPGDVAFAERTASVEPGTWAEGGGARGHHRDVLRARRLPAAGARVQRDPRLRVQLLLDQRVRARHGGSVTADPPRPPEQCREQVVKITV